MGNETTKHGDYGRRLEKIKHGRETQFIAKDSGEEIYSGPVCSVRQTGNERFCENCGGVEGVGIFQGLANECPNCRKSWEQER